MPHVNKLFKSAKIYGQISEQHRTINLVSERLNVQNKNELKDLKVKEEQRFLLRRACPVDRQAPAGSPRGGESRVALRLLRLCTHSSEEKHLWPEKVEKAKMKPFVFHHVFFSIKFQIPREWKPKS